jgi:circadian clock protein KaiC
MNDRGTVLGRTEVGIPGFDALVHGGLPEGRSILLAGSTGTGKTVFGLQFLADGARLGEPGVLVTFAEQPDDLIANTRRRYTPHRPQLPQSADRWVTR